jgi:hypothetical protein
MSSHDEFGGVASAAHAEGTHRFGDVAIDRRRRDAQIDRNLLGRPPREDQLQAFALARAELFHCSVLHRCRNLPQRTCLARIVRYGIHCGDINLGRVARQLSSGDITKMGAMEPDALVRLQSLILGALAIADGHRWNTIGIALDEARLALREEMVARGRGACVIDVPAPDSADADDLPFG